MPANQFKMKAKVWLYPGAQAAWHFLSLPKKQSSQIKKLFGDLSGGWGSLPVKVTIGQTTWQTSIFPTSAKATAGMPDKKRGAYLLPLKAEVRKKEKIAEGDMIVFTLEIRV